MSKLKLVFSVFIFTFCSLSYGQTVHIVGHVVAETETIDLGQVVVFNRTDSSLVKGTYLDSTFFSLNFNPRNKTEFYLKISLPNYLDTLVDFDVTDTLVDIGIIALTKNQDLAMVDVVFKKEMFTRTMDGITVNVEGTNLQSLTNLFEVLKASPKITSPDDETIEIIGRGSPLIMVDRQAIISNDELKAIPASQIERIEIITNPSAKYKAQGSGNGVIEVFTKSFHLEGYNMTIRTSGGLNTQLKPSASFNAGISLKKKKFSLNGYLGAHYNSSNGFSETVGSTTDDSNRESRDINEFDNYNVWQYYSLKGAYNLTDKQRISMGVNGYGSFGGSSSNSMSDYLTNDILITSSSSNSNSDWTWLNNSAFINYTVETDTNNSNFSVNLNYVNKISNSDATSLSDFEFVADGQKSQFDVQNISKDIPNIGELRFDYEHYFDTTGWKLNVGGSYNALVNGKTFDRYNLVENEWVIDNQFSNSYDYQEHIGAAFAEVSKKWKKIGFRVGVRTEYTRLDGYSYSLEQQFMDSSYILPFPTASLMLEPSDKLGITFYYDSGIDRPQFSNYDPFVRVNDSLSISYGNPYLRPGIQKTIGVDFDIMYAYSLSLSYSFKKDPMSTISFIDDDSFVRESTPWNATSEEGISASVSLPLQFSWLSGWNSFWMNYNKYTFTEEFGRDPFYNLSFGFYSYLTFTLPRDFNIMNRLNISKWGGDQAENNTVADWGIRLTKKYNGGNFQLFGEVGNIIPPKNRSTNYSGNYIYTSVAQREFTTFKAGLFIKFGRLRAPAQIKESTSGQSDRI